MFDKILVLLETINLEELKQFTVEKETMIDDIINILQWLESEKKRNIEFVHGIGKRKTKIQKWAEQLKEYKERQERYNFSKNLFLKKIVILKLILMQLSRT